MADEVELVASLPATPLAYALVLRRVLARRSYSGPRGPKGRLKTAAPLRQGPTNFVNSAKRLEAA